MTVIRRQAFRRVPVQSFAQADSKIKTLPPPNRGLILNENVAAMKPGGALVLENFFPTTKGVRVRGGSSLHATIGNDRVHALIRYRSATVEKLFAASTNSLFDVTTPASTTAAPPFEFTGQTNGEYSWTQFGTVADEFLYLVNGSDPARLYDGSTWSVINATSTPAITGVATSSLSHVWVYANRIFFVEDETMSAWYLPVDSVGGAALEMSLAGVFQRGGYLLSGATWSADADEFRLPSRCCFISSEGEVAVYQGSDPASAATWSLIGVYDLGGKPLGKNAIIKVAGDLLIMTEDGIVPMSAVVSKDPGALSMSMITFPIESLWRSEVVNRKGNPWYGIKWPDKNMGLITLPAPAGAPSDDFRCLAINLQTGAWCVFTGWDATVFQIKGDSAFFGTRTGTIMKCEDGGSDNGSPYYCKMAGHFDHFGSVAHYKFFHMARATFQAERNFIAKVSISLDYKVDFPSAPPVATEELTVWDTGIWDTSVWDGPLTSMVRTNWKSLNRNGMAVAAQVQITCDQVLLPQVELASFDVLYEPGGAVV